MRYPTDQERADNPGVGTTIEGQPALCLSHDQLIEIYQNTHRWLHEINPYTEPHRTDFYTKNGASFWQEMGKVDRFIDKHFISIGGEGFFCVLRDKVDGQTKVQAVSRPPDWRAR